MTKSLIAFVTFLGLVFGLNTFAVAADHQQNLSQGLTGAGVGLAAHGYDTVAFHTVGTPTRGQGKFEAVYNDATYRFASAENLAEFQKDPAKYAPEFGGYCAFGVSVGKKFDGDPRYWNIHEGKLYFTLSADVYRLFLKDVAGSVKKADTNWQTIADKAPADL